MAYRPYNPEEDPMVRKPVDENGMRLAPPPIEKDNLAVLHKAYQPIEFQPNVAGTDGARSSDAEESTSSDFQPKKRDINKRWKRNHRAKNIVAGIIMLIVTAATLMPYILGACKVDLSSWPFVFAFLQFDVFGKLVDAIRLTIAASPDTNAAWLNMTMNLMLLVGIVALAFNLLKSVLDVFGTIKPKKYYVSSVIYLLAVLAVFVASLVGAETVGLAKVDFLQDVIFGYATSELFTLAVFAVGNLLMSIVVSLISPEKSGYIK